MILSNILQLKTNTETYRQKIIVKCDCCANEYETAFGSQIQYKEKYKKDLCRSCKQKDQIKSGIRKKQYINAGRASIKNMKGKTYEEMYGKEKAEKLKIICSKNTRGEKNPNHNGKWHGSNPAINQKGKSLEAIYGIEKAANIKNKLSLKSKGSNNPMYGKPAPPGSGNGWSGWYRNWHFRSLLELSYVINVLERFNFKWECAERKKYRIEYKDWDGATRNYFPDFIVNDNYMIEIKPKSLHNSKNVILKKEAAENFCKNNNLIYKLTTPIKTLSHDDIKTLVESGKIKFTEKYKEKYKLWHEENL